MSKAKLQNFISDLVVAIARIALLLFSGIGFYVCFKAMVFILKGLEII